MGAAMPYIVSRNTILSKVEKFAVDPKNLLTSLARLRDGKTGAQAIECLRAKFNSMIPAIIVTGDTDPERLREAQKSGNALIHKPAQPAKLRAFLRSAQRRQA